MLFFFLPEGKVFFKKFNDRFGISERFLVDVVDLLKGLRKCVLSELDSLLLVAHHFVVENGEVESQSKSDWVASVKGLGSLAGKLVVLKGTVLDGIKLITGGALSNISVIITDHLVEEGFGLVSGSLGHARVLDNFDNLDALIVELLLDLLLVLSETFVELLVLWVLLDGTDSSNGGSLGADLVLETDGKQVSLLSGEILGFVANN